MSGQQKRSQLPPRDYSLFKQVLKHHEEKSYKKALKLCEQILKRYPDHGETLAMKGLTLNSMEKKEEAIKFVKLGLAKDMQSHVCWHVYGLVHRADSNFSEATKCYRMALKRDPENLQILRDLAHLQMQVRDFEGLVGTRHQLLQLRSNQRNSWIGYALALHLTEQYKKAVHVLSVYEDTLKEQPTDVEYSEMLMYHNSILVESGDLEQALAHSELIHEKVFEKKSNREIQGSLLLKLRRFGDAEKVYRELLDLNPDCIAYHEGLLASLQISGDEEDATIAVLEELSEKYPKSLVCRRSQLTIATGDRFREKFNAYALQMLQKGVPSFFSGVKNLYKFPDKVKVIEETLLSFEEDCTLVPSGKEKENPQLVIWVWLFLAQHFDRLGDHARGLEFIARAEGHTPTLLEVYLIKGRILKHVGRAGEASDALELGRKLDLADRYLNTKSVLYLLRADKVELAFDTISLFTKSPEELNTLFDMQVMWYELEAGWSYERRGKLGSALERFHAVIKHYNDWMEDQFDFHSYCLRKATLRAYVELLRFESFVREQKGYVDACLGIVRCNLALKEERTRPSKTEGKEEMPIKKQKHKKEEKEKKKGEKSKGEQGDEPAKVKVDYTAVDDPLAEALKYASILQTVGIKDFVVHKLSFDVQWQRKKLCLALQSLLRASRSALSTSKTAEVAEMVQRLGTGAESEWSSLARPVQELLSSELELLCTKFHINGEFKLEVGQVGTEGEEKSHRVAV